LGFHVVHQEPSNPEAELQRLEAIAAKAIAAKAKLECAIKCAKKEADGRKEATEESLACENARLKATVFKMKQLAKNARMHRMAYEQGSRKRMRKGNHEQAEENNAHQSSLAQRWTKRDISGDEDDEETEETPLGMDYQTLPDEDEASDAEEEVPPEAADEINHLCWSASDEEQPIYTPDEYEADALPAGWAQDRAQQLVAEFRSDMAEQHSLWRPPKSQEPCRYFMTSKGCRFWKLHGKKCPYLHDAEQEPKQWGWTPCKFFAKNHCTKGEQCRWLHSDDVEKKLWWSAKQKQRDEA